MLNTVIQGDCLDILKTIPDGSVDMVLTDPPYSTTPCPWDMIIPFEPLWKELRRITKPHKAIVLFAAQPFTTHLINSNLDMFKYTWVWEKNQVAGFAQAKNKPMTKHEDIVVFSDGVTVHKGQSDRRMPYYPQGLIEVNKTVKQKLGYKRETVFRPSKSHKTSYVQTHTNYPSTVLKFDCERGLHPTQKPVKLLEYLIRTYTLEHETVLDFTCGSGSTAIAAINSDRNYMCIEKDNKYYEVAANRIKERLNEQV